MKKLKHLIKLTNFNSENLNENELSHVLSGDGDCCSCSCFYCSCGGASNADNDAKNTEGCKVSPLPPEYVDCGVCT